MDATRGSTRDLARQVIDQGLLATEALLEQPEPPPGYELLRCLGRGGCGVVWQARDLRLDRSVAIKFLSDARAADLERFRREARFTARLNNPSIVQIHELGDSAAQPYIVMQYIDGENLANAALEVAEVVRVVRDVAQALRHAHGEGIVHRDIKPENILLDRELRAYLTDFGIARSLRGGLADTISSEGQIMGTPGLMPPEQAEGEIQAVDARSDIYALGATLYLKLTGHYPFEATSVVDVLHAVIHDPPPLMRARDAAIPRSLETVAARCMQKRREDRYQRVEDVIADLDRFLEKGDSVQPSSAWIQRLVGQKPNAPARLPDEPHADTWWTVGMDIVRDLAAWDADLYRISGSLARSFIKLDAIRGRLEEILDIRPDTAWARFYRGVAFFRRGSLREALEDMERGIDRMRNLAGASFELGKLYLALHLRDQHLARRHLSKEGADHDLRLARGRLEQAVLAFQEAQKLGGEVPPWLSDCTRAVARLAESDYAGCVETCDRILAEDPDVEGIWKLRGDALHLAGGDPFESYDRALEIRRSYFEALCARAEAHLARRQITEARQALERALQIHEQCADAFALMARSWLIDARSTRERPAIETGIEFASRALALDPRHYDASVTLAELRILLGRSTGERQFLDTALEILTRARELEGCPNRVNLLTARTRLEYARQAASRGGDPRPDLEAVLVACDHDGARVADNQPWEAVRLEAEAELGRHRG